MFNPCGHCTYIDDVKGLVDGALDIKGETGIDFRGDPARDDIEDLFAKFDQQSIKRCVDFLVR